MNKFDPKHRREIAPELRSLLETATYLKERIWKLCNDFDMLGGPQRREGWYPVWIICCREIVAYLQMSRSNFVSNYKIGGKKLLSVEFTDDRTKAYVFESPKECLQVLQMIKKAKEVDFWEDLRDEECWWDETEQKFFFYDAH